MGERVFLGLGSNLGDREQFIERAIALLSKTSGIELMGKASLYEAEPVGYEDQPWFLNTVIEIRTRLSPKDLLARLHEIECQLGRQPGERWGPREIDLDILLYGERVMDELDLMIPHPELHKRRFVLLPFVEIAPRVIHPQLAKTMEQLLQALDDPKGVILSRGSQRSDEIKRF